MAFFGLEQNDLLEREKQKFLQGGEQASADLPEFTWGEESYDGLGTALQEGGDDFNDETFGGSGPVGKDFDFSAQALPTEGLPSRAAGGLGAIGGDFGYAPQRLPSESIPHSNAPPTDLPDIHNLRLNEPYSQSPQLQQRAPVAPARMVWDDRSPMQALPRMGSANRVAQHPAASFLPFDTLQSNEFGAGIQPPLPRNGSHAAYHTAQEIEEEMRLAALRQREAQARELQAREQQQLQEHYERLRLQELQAMQRAELDYQQQSRTPPPRMHPHSQSPRFHHQLQQHILVQQQREQAREQHAFHSISAQLRAEELARRERELGVQASPQARLLAEQQLATQTQRLGSPGQLDPRLAVELQQLRRASPAFDPHIQQLHSVGTGAAPRGTQILPDDIQMQQIMLRRNANDEFLREMVGSEQVGRRIMEAERMEEQRRRKAAKISHMSRYNDLMTQSDKDFITRIQVSQLVTQDPYAEDFYAQTYSMIMRSKMGLQNQDLRVLNFGSGGGVGLGMSQRPSGRRASAMQKMEAQVEKIVQAARIREKEKGMSSLHSLQGALGKTAGRSYKAAPRQLLQVDEHGKESESVSKQAAHSAYETLGGAGTDDILRRDPLSRRESLAILERLYDLVGILEAKERERPPQEDAEAFEEWSQGRPELLAKLWEELRISAPMETSTPHPFASLMMPAKGKRILPRVVKFLAPDQSILLVTLLVALMPQLDVVAGAPLLDSVEPSEERTEVDRNTQIFLDILHLAVVPIISGATLAQTYGLIGLLSNRTDVVAVAKTEPGALLLTLLLSRTEQITRDVSEGFMAQPPTQEEARNWAQVYHFLFVTLAPHLMALFPSVRMTGSVVHTEAVPAKVDSSTWHLMSMLAANGAHDQWMVIVGALRDKIVGDVKAANQGVIKSAEERMTILTNIDLLLRPMQLDIAQLTAL